MQGNGPVPPPPPPRAGIETLAAELYLTADFIQNVELLLEEKKQVIFQGPPGTGRRTLRGSWLGNLRDLTTGSRLCSYTPPTLTRTLCVASVPR